MKALKLSLKAIVREYSGNESFMIKRILWNVETIARYLQEVEAFLDQRQKRDALCAADEVAGFPSEGKAEELSSSPREFASQELELSTRRMHIDTRVVDLVSKELPDESKVGYILPLNCGHNASPSLAELNTLQKHLINAHIVELADSP